MEPDRNQGFAAAVSALRTDTRIPPNARLYLARASLFADAKGRTRYGPTRYATDMGDSEESGQRAINWLTAAGLILNDTDDNGVECWRLTHYDWNTPEPKIKGYGPDAGLPKNGLPPAYGRPVSHVTPPVGGNLDYTPPAWDQIKPLIAPAPTPMEQDQ